MSIPNSLNEIKKLKVLTLVGTRPEIIRLSRIITKLDIFFDHNLVHTGQNYDFELNEIFFKDLGLRQPDIYLECAHENLAEAISNIIARSDEVFEKLNPDAILILGDTNSSLAAIPAKRRKIPIFHMEAGNRCFDLRVPEEINRKIVDHISDINMPYSTIGREYLLREGILPQNIIKTGSPMREVLNYYSNQINSSNILENMKLKKNDYFLVSVHREENVDDPNNFKEFIGILNTLSLKFKKRIIVSTHPRTRKKISTSNNLINPLVEFHKPLAFTDYCKLQLTAKVVLSDSGTITEESSILCFPAINLRAAHERPEGMEEGAVIFTGMKINSVLNAVEIVEKQGRGLIKTLENVNDYLTENVSEKIIRIISSYTQYVNEFTWKK